MDFIPRLSTIIERADIHNNVKKPFRELSSEQIYSGLVEYYQQFTEIDTTNYKFKKDDELIHETRTSLYTPENFSYEGFEDLSASYSNYSQRALSIADLDNDNIWNGESSICIYDDDKMKFGETDYYTSTIPSRLLYMESANAVLKADGAATEIERSNFPLRNSVLSSESELFDTPTFNTGASSGGVLIGKYNGKWQMLLARRSSKPKVNQGLVTVVPNGSVEYGDLKEGNPFETALRREFSEELFSTVDKGTTFFDSNINSSEISVGWNLRSGSVAVGNVMYAEPDKFEKVIDANETNFEFSELIPVPIMDINNIGERLKIGDFSPSVIPIVARSLIHFDNRADTPDLPYDIIEH